MTLHVFSLNLNWIACLLCYNAKQFISVCFWAKKNGEMIFGGFHSPKIQPKNEFDVRNSSLRCSDRRKM